jgi:hypothetical protein
MITIQSIARPMSRLLVVVGVSVLAFAAITPAHTEVPPDPGARHAYRGGQRLDFPVTASTPKAAGDSELHSQSLTAPGNFHAVWATDYGIYIGLWQVGNAVDAYYWDGAWYWLAAGTVSGNVLSGSWNVEGYSGTATITLTSARVVNAVIREADGSVLATVTGSRYLEWAVN